MLMQSSASRKLAVVLEYDGTRCHGFQLQANAPTIQGEVEQALERLCGERVRVKGASRTDSGAHAWGQVATFVTHSGHGEEVFLRALNQYLPAEIAVRAVYPVPWGFNPRRDALARAYRYSVWNGPAPSPLHGRFAHHIPGPLDQEDVARALRLLEGTHDFSPFSGPLPSGRSPVRRVIGTRVWRNGEMVLAEVEATAFLPHQMRRMVGAALQVGRGRLSWEAFQALADGRGQPAWAPLLPAKGLCLMRVTYQDFPPGSANSTSNLQRVGALAVSRVDEPSPKALGNFWDEATPPRSGVGSSQDVVLNTFLESQARR